MCFVSVLNCKKSGLVMNRIEGLGEASIELPSDEDGSVLF